jgi:hypothetical protein
MVSMSGRDVDEALAETGPGPTRSAEPPLMGGAALSRYVIKGVLGRVAWASCTARTIRRSDG